MQINIKSKSLPLSTRQKKMIYEKVERLKHLADRLNDESSELRVEVNYQDVRRSQDAYICQITIFAPHAVMRAETRGEKLANTVDECLEKIRKPIARYKVKINRLDIKKSGTKPADLATEEMEPEGEGFDIPKILRRKRFSDTSAISEEDAIDRMEMIGHDFFIFNNIDTGRYSLVYKRGDGYYGIIEPKMEND